MFGVNRTRPWIVLVTVLFSFSVVAQVAKNDPCDKAVTFCWYGPYSDGSDEVDAWGERWVPEEASKKPMAIDTAIRCLKKLGICVKAESHKIAGKALIRVDILPITRWTSHEISADGEDKLDPCERETFMVNMIDRSVLMIASPGPGADRSGCTGVLGKPRTIMYKLGQ